MKSTLTNGTSPFLIAGENKIDLCQKEEEFKESEIAAEIRNRVYGFGEFSFSTENFERKKITNFEGSINQMMMRELRRKTFEEFTRSSIKK